jgi:hypothetical protein
MAVSTGRQSIILAKAQGTYGTAITTGLEQVPILTETFNTSKNATEIMHLRGDRLAEKFHYPFQSTEAEITFNLSPCDIFGELLVAASCSDTNYIPNTTTDSSATHSIGTTQRQFTFERNFNFANVTKDCQVFKDMQVNTFAIAVPASGFVECTVSMQGSDVTHGDTPSGSQSSADYFHTPFDAGNCTVSIGDTADDTSPTVQTGIVDFNLTIDNGMSPTYTVGAETPRQNILGKSVVSGSFTMHFETGAFYEVFLTEATRSLQLQIGSGNDGINFYMPEVAFTNVTIDNAEDLTTYAVEFTALAHHGSDGAVEKSSLIMDFDLNS